MKVVKVMTLQNKKGFPFEIYSSVESLLAILGSHLRLKLTYHEDFM
jgi:hypothetical protein